MNWTCVASFITVSIAVVICMFLSSKNITKTPDQNFNAQKSYGLLYYFRLYLYKFCKGTVKLPTGLLIVCGYGSVVKICNPDIGLEFFFKIVDRVCDAFERIVETIFGNSGG